jgi:FixJ family two-component response regulator
MMSTDNLQREENATPPELIAVVDDDASFLRSVGRLLRSAGHTVDAYASARQFLSALPASAPPCLVLDVHMPEMTGLELQERLAAQGTHLPIIFVTAYDTPATRQRVQGAGSVGLLLKPFDKEALLTAVRKALESRAGGAPPEEPESPHTA